MTICPVVTERVTDYEIVLRVHVPPPDSSVCRQPPTDRTANWASSGTVRLDVPVAEIGDDPEHRRLAVAGRLAGQEGQPDELHVDSPGNPTLTPDAQTDDFEAVEVLLDRTDVGSRRRYSELVNNWTNWASSGDRYLFSPGDTPTRFWPTPTNTASNGSSSIRSSTRAARRRCFGRSKSNSSGAISRSRPHPSSDRHGRPHSPAPRRSRSISPFSERRICYHALSADIPLDCLTGAITATSSRVLAPIAFSRSRR